MTNGTYSGSTFADSAPGFYAPETLDIAVKAVANAKSMYQAFCYSQRPEGDNDSTAALALELWCWEHGGGSDLERLKQRLIPGDQNRLNSSLELIPP